jgi:purine-binding chemotaxis protein CheW
MAATHSHAELFLICRSAGHRCALPLATIKEIMRPLPLERVTQSGAVTAFVLGAAVVRGAVVPVVSLAGLFGRADAVLFARYVSLRLGTRSAMLAVEEVLGIHALGEAEAMAPLLGAVEHGAVSAVTIHDAELLYILQTAKLVPDAAWEVAP